MSLNLFAGIMRAGLTIIKKNTIDLFIFLMYFSTIINLTAQFINYFLCKNEEEIYSICVGTWITFSITLEWTLAFICILQYLTFYLLQTQSKDFLDELKNSKKQFMFFALFFPILINLLNLFVHNSYYRIFYPPKNKFQVIVLFAPLAFLLIIITIFTVLAIRILIKSKDFTLNIRQRFKQTLNISLWMILITFIPYLLIVIAAQFTNSLNICYFVLLGIVNLQVLQYNYLFGMNPYIHKIQLLKISKLIGITASDIDESEQYSHTQTQTFTETQLTNNLRLSNNHSKVAEMAKSRDSANIRSETQKQIKVVNSEKQQVTQVELKQKAKSQKPS